MIETTIQDHIAHVELCRESKHNALDGEMMTGLVGAARQIADDHSIRCVVLSGRGPSFCAGLDIANFGAMASGTLTNESANVQAAYADLSANGANRAQQVAWCWRELEIPVIAALHGTVLGGGLNLALGADLRVAAPTTSLGFVEITWGLIPDMSASQSLRRLVGDDRAKHLVLTAERFSGADALRWGLVTEVHDDPLLRAMEVATTMASHNPEAVRAALAVLDHATDSDTHGGLAEEARRSAALLGSPNQTEAVRARLESRSPAFKDPSLPL